MTLAINENPPPCFPESLFGKQQNSSKNGNWWVARTKSRQEKALAWNLHKQGISYFLPLVPRPQKCRKRVRTSIIPLFSGYLFFKGDLDARYKALSSGKVAQVIEVEGQQTLARELQYLHQLTHSQAELTLCDFLTRGKKVAITDGPFAGMEGIIQKRKNKKRLVLQITSIRQAAAVEIDTDQALPVS